MKGVLKTIKFNITQYEWGRKSYGGTYYLISTIQLRMAPFWSDTEIKSCQSKTLSVQHFKRKKITT